MHSLGLGCLFYHAGTYFDGHLLGLLSFCVLPSGSVEPTNSSHFARAKSCQKSKYHCWTKSIFRFAGSSCHIRFHPSHRNLSSHRAVLRCKPKRPPGHLGLTKRYSDCLRLGAHLTYPPPANHCNQATLVGIGGLWTNR